MLPNPNNRLRCFLCSHTLVTLCSINCSRGGLNDTLCSHSIEDLLEACEVSTYNVVALETVLLSSLINVVEEVLHDVLELGINFLECPAQTLAVLGHLKSRCSNTAGIGSLARNKVNLVVLEILCSLFCSRHISTLANSHYAVSNESLSIFNVKLVLSSARKSNVALNSPNALALMILGIRTIVLVLGKSCSLNFLDLLESFNIDSVRIVNPTGRIRACNDLSAELLSLLDSVCCNV